MVFLLVAFCENAKAQNSITVRINPTATYLHTNDDSNSTSTVPIDLQALGIGAGDTVQLQSSGTLSYYTGCPVCSPPVPGDTEIATNMIGVFSSSNALFPSGFLSRVPGAIDAGLPRFITNLTLMGNQLTDIPQDFFISNTAPLSVEVPTGAKYLFVAASDGFYGDNGDADSNFAVTINYSAKATLNAGLGAGPADSSTQSKSVGTSGISAAFPLGSQFFLQLTKPDKTEIVSDFSLSSPDIAPFQNEPSLFSNHAVIEFSSDTADDMKYFQAVHLGTELLTITPLDTSLPAVTVSITINRPTSLGSTNNQFDSSLITLGNERGIPPQFLKGQVAKETNFIPDRYRYEVLSVDLKYVSAGQNLRKQNPYARYRLATSDGLAQGSDILSEDVSRRSIYKIVVNGTTRPIADNDALVSAKNIYDTNDYQENWSINSPARAAMVAKKPELLQFTAQTPIAASYGLLQILYDTAIKPMSWSGIDGARNPSYLFDTDVNIAGGGGSLSLASGYLRRIFARANPTISVTDPSFASPSDFTDAFDNAFNYYNHSSTTGEYGPLVILKAERFLPTQATPIFP